MRRVGVFLRNLLVEQPPPASLALGTLPTLALARKCAAGLAGEG